MSWGTGYRHGTPSGIDERTGEDMIHDGAQVKYARTILRKPKANKFKRDELAKIAVTP